MSGEQSKHVNPPITILQGGAIFVAPKLQIHPHDYICYLIESQPSNHPKWQHNFSTPKFLTLPKGKTICDGKNIGTQNCDAIPPPPTHPLPQQPPTHRPPTPTSRISHLIIDYLKVVKINRGSLQTAIFCLAYSKLDFWKPTRNHMMYFFFQKN